MNGTRAMHSSTGSKTPPPPGFLPMHSPQQSSSLLTPPRTPGTSSLPGITKDEPISNRKSSLYKTELCRSWEETGQCRYGNKCQFAHSLNELRQIDRHPKYKTEMCKTFWEKGTCPYGKRCCFIHNEKDKIAEYQAAQGKQQQLQVAQQKQSSPELDAARLQPTSPSSSNLANVQMMANGKTPSSPGLTLQQPMAFSPGLPHLRHRSAEDEFLTFNNRSQSPFSTASSVAADRISLSASPSPPVETQNLPGSHGSVLLPSSSASRRSSSFHFGLSSLDTLAQDLSETLPSLSRRDTPGPFEDYSNPLSSYYGTAVSPSSASIPTPPGIGPLMTSNRPRQHSFLSNASSSQIGSVGVISPTLHSVPFERRLSSAGDQIMASSSLFNDDSFISKSWAQSSSHFLNSQKSRARTLTEDSYRFEEQRHQHQLKMQSSASQSLNSRYGLNGYLDSLDESLGF